MVFPLLAEDRNIKTVSKCQNVEKKKFEITVLRGPSAVPYLLMYVGILHCTVAVSIMVQAKKHVCLDIQIGGDKLQRNQVLALGSQFTRARRHTRAHHVHVDVAQNTAP